MVGVVNGWTGRGFVPRVGDGEIKLRAFTGLSDTLCGHLLVVERDEQSRRGRVVVRAVVDRGAPTDVERSALVVAAGLLAARARRVLQHWVIDDWDGSVLPSSVVNYEVDR